ncbi:hypothetical protein B0F90DRAFT_828374 [Multifurca ochricompacta]|uniref:Uncharacterized protein n=1 Tax=Multifurca ochricompacta TaxID=376703 RepID=A0AAD4QKY7_9AGAM|nr:hypothetical protein B0F90DRAFT_828374 [Multifurca ochricompacta]
MKSDPAPDSTCCAGAPFVSSPPAKESGRSLLARTTRRVPGPWIIHLKALSELTTRVHSPVIPLPMRSLDKKGEKKGRIQHQEPSPDYHSSKSSPHIHSYPHVFTTRHYLTFGCLLTHSALVPQDPALSVIHLFEKKVPTNESNLTLVTSPGKAEGEEKGDRLPGTPEAPTQSRNFSKGNFWSAAATHAQFRR